MFANNFLIYTITCVVFFKDLKKNRIDHTISVATAGDNVRSTP